jgi:hypothetical protein
VNGGGGLWATTTQPEEGGVKPGIFGIGALCREYFLDLLDVGWDEGRVACGLRLAGQRVAHGLAGWATGPLGGSCGAGRLGADAAAFGPPRFLRLSKA